MARNSLHSMIMREAAVCSRMKPKGNAMTINTAEIEARLAKEYWNDSDTYSQYADISQACADIAVLLAALKAETARADDLQKDAVRLVQEKMNVIEQLIAANEKLAAVKAFANSMRKSHQLVGPAEYHDRPAFMKVWVRTRYHDGKALMNMLRANTGDGNGR